MGYFTVGDWGFFRSEPLLAYPVLRSRSPLNFQMKPVLRWTVQYVVLGPRKSPMPLVRVFSENDKIFRQEKKYVE